MEPRQFTNRSPGTVVKTSEGIYTFVPNDLPSHVDFLPDIRDECESAMLALGRLSAVIPTLPNPELLTEPFMRREAVLSSRIEGTKTEVGQLYLFETEEKKGIGSTLKQDDFGDAREVFNYVAALQYGLDSLPKMPVCNRLLREMHQILMDGVSDERGQYKSPGEFRDRQAYIGSGGIKTARYVAPPAANVPTLMGWLERYINADQKALPTLVKIAFVHYQFEGACKESCVS